MTNLLLFGIFGVLLYKFAPSAFEICVLVWVAVVALRIGWFVIKLVFGPIFKGLYVVSKKADEAYQRFYNRVTHWWNFPQRQPQPRAPKA